jgi:AcrR family transcriptional regulator
MVADVAQPRRYRMAARAEAAAATADRVLAVAWRQFGERPFEDVRMEEIAAAADVTVQTVHARFGRKDDLFVAAWRRRMESEGARRESAPMGDVEAAVHVLYDSYEDAGDAALRLIAQEHRIPAVLEMTEAGRAWHRRWVERTFAPLLGDLEGADRERRLVGLVVATDLLVWKLLRREMKLDRPAAERVVLDMVAAPGRAT